ncbi:MULTISPECIES: AAC(3)-I family aminoglycoside N-acetyltransferase [unclassified Roseovarius]|uniref:AAC(3)-I family aminoglycoside N-acetyltransferase n=1 Tax=unclassified Roseovarius TaxID=2614913 RepID=UPI00273FF6F8|nr:MULTISPECIES: AAC(3)-I family aminoglycoside N-acetyltransferase [unclassified Roseovarius]
MTKQQIHRLRPGDERWFEGMLDLFAAAFEDNQSYTAARPGRRYRTDLLNRRDVIALVAIEGEEVAGAAVAYELPKLEQERSEMYLYDLAVALPYRRQGVATALIETLRKIAREQGAWVLFVQADYGDDPAVALYTKLGQREDVMHFDIPID